MMQSDTRNTVLAVVLSLVVLIGWQFLIEGPRHAERQAQQQAALEAAREAEGDPAAGAGATDPLPAPVDPGLDAGLEGLPGAAVEGGGVPRGVLDRTQAIAESARVRIVTDRVRGSLSLAGGRLDDLELLDYRVTTEEDSPQIVLLSPERAANPYYTDFGWVGAGGQATPGPNTVWSADRDMLTPESPVTLTWDNGQGLRFEKRIEIDRDYMFTVTQRVINTTDQTVDLSPYGRVRRVGRPQTENIFILHEGPYGVFDETLDEYSYSDLEDDGTISASSTGGWLGFTDKYWLVALIPDQASAYDAQFAYRGPDPDVADLPGVGDRRYFATFRGETAAVPPGGEAQFTTHVFAGAKEYDLINAYDEALDITRFDLTIDFGWFYFLTKPFFIALTAINSVVGNFGVAILLLTVAVKLVFYPLADKSYRAMSKMKALQPQMMELQERYKDDRQKMQMELMALYKKEKVNPASGCLPILIQIPVFFALYKVLFVTIEMRHAPFFGWVQDLSAPDPTSLFNLFGLLPYDVPGFLLVGIWPILMGVTMYLQQKLNPAPADPIQARIFMALPIVFTFLLATFPAGLVIYWTWNNLLSILQQWIIMKRMGVKIGGGVEKPKTTPKAAKKADHDDDAASDDERDGEDAADTRDDAAEEDESEPKPVPERAAAPKRARVSSAARKKGGGRRGQKKRA